MDNKINDIKTQFNSIVDDVKRQQFIDFLNDLKSKVDTKETFDNLINIEDFIYQINKKKKNMIQSEDIYNSLEDLKELNFHKRAYSILSKIIKNISDDAIEFESALAKIDLKRAFNYSFSKGKFFVKFKEYLSECVTKWILQEVQTPIAVLSQSSGHGKSRLMREFSNEEICLYINLQSNISSGFPKRSKLADDFLNQMNSTFNAVHILFCFVTAGLDLYEEIKTKNIKMSKKDMSREFVSHQPWYDEDEAGSYSHLFSLRVDALIQTTKQSNKNDFNLTKKFNSIMGENSLFIFIDEAGSLLEPVIKDLPILKLHYFRKAVETLFEKLRIVFIVTDTNSKITNFIPKACILKNDLTNETLEPPNRPFYSSFFIDKLDGPSKYLNSLVNYSYDKLKERDPNKTVFCLGRPLWQSLFSAGASYNEVIEVAISKLISARKWRESKEFPKDLASLAVFSVRTTISLGYNSNFGPELVSKYMATLFYIDNNRNETAFRYFSEPMLAQGMQ